MTRQVTIVTYHYVRDGGEALYALDIAAFDRQLDHIADHYVPVTLRDVTTACPDPTAQLPDRACLLTFDDGYSDHYRTVFPRLAARGWKGLFFPVVRAARDREVLDANKIQFVLAAAGIDAVTFALRQAYSEACEEYGLPDFDAFHRSLAADRGHYNKGEIRFVKLALQTELPIPLRRAICADLFRRHVTADERAFADELYASASELREMQEAGMALGGHGAWHDRMNRLDADARQTEFDSSRAFLESLGVATGDGWPFCYPYGARDDSTLAAARSAGCSIGFTIKPRIADLDADSPLALPRKDAMELPH